ncbi:unnamed protein product [Rhodiola kirilowii]
MANVSLTSLSHLHGYSPLTSVSPLTWVFTIDDTVRRRMMMTSGEAVKYKSSFDAFSQILMNEGDKSLFKGAGVLAGYDKLQVLVLGKKYGSGGA